MLNVFFVANKLSPIPIKAVGAFAFGVQYFIGFCLLLGNDNGFELEGQFSHAHYIEPRMVLLVKFYRKRGQAASPRRGRRLCRQTYTDK